MGASTPSQTKARLIVISIFVMGFVGGALSMNLYHRATNDKPKEDGSGKVRGNIIETINKKVDLTTEQESEIKAILDDTFGKYRAIREQMDQNPEVKKYLPQFDEVRRAQRERIRAVLTEEQKPKYEELLKEIDEDRKKHGERGKQNK